MKITELALEKRTVSHVLAIYMLLGGFFSYIHLGRLEFPPITIKTAVVVTSYPGASPEEVEQEVTDPLEKAI